jgi:CYTH domain-containing protein
MLKKVKRKFLVNVDKLPELTNPKYLKQGYFSLRNDPVIKIKIIDDSKAFLTLCFSDHNQNHYEYEISLKDAQELYNKCEGIIEKKYYLLQYEGKTWEINVFEKKNKGLVLASLESNQITEEFEAPEFIKEEVSQNQLYTNTSLATYPYQDWYFYIAKQPKTLI